MPKDNLYAIILAAGKSSRMSNTPKQLLKWQNRSLLEHTLHHVRNLFKERIILVLGAHHDLITANLDLNSVNTLINPDWKLGISSSIQAGLKALPADATGAIIILSDQPLIKDQHFETLVNTWQARPTHIVASEYHHSVGVPAIFPKQLFAELHELKGDQGAKAILLKYADTLLKVPLPEAELDIDSPEDFITLLAHISSKNRTLQ